MKSLISRECLNRISNSGFSLLELMIAMSIVSILASIAIPSLSTLIGNTLADTAQADLRRAIAATRNLAVATREIATLCPDEDCAGEWSEGYILFSDNNNNARIDEEETIYQRFHSSKNILIHWRGSGKANYLKFSATGVARQFGRFHLCPKEDEISKARAMVINRQGRIRIYKDRDKNGVVEDTDGSEPICK